MIKKILYICYCLFLGILSINAQEASVSAELDTTDVLIGDWLQLKLKAVRTKEQTIVWPSLVESLPANEDRSVEILKSTPIDTLVENDMVTESRTLTLTAFDSGYYVILPISFGILKEDESVDSLATEPLLLTVQTVPADTTMPMKPIKDPLDMPFQLSEIRDYLIGGLVLLILLAGLIYWWSRRRKNVPLVVFREEPKRPPHEVALEKLKALEDKKLWQQETQVKAYYSELTEIVRAYIEGRFQIDALESTTDELMDKFYRIGGVDGMTKAELKDLLQLADLVKFAKAAPLPDEHMKVMKLSYTFVEKTKMEAATEATEEKKP